MLSLQYAVSFRVDPGVPLPAPDGVFRGKTYTFQNIPLEVATMTIAMYKGVEGELPFPYHGPADGKSDMLFADLRTSGTVFRHARLF